MTLNEKLAELDFLPNLSGNLRLIDLTQIETFVKGKVSHLFLKKTRYEIQRTVDADIDPVIVNFFTHIIEVGSVKSVAINRQDNKSSRDLAAYAHVLVWAYNIALALELKQNGMANIPSISNGLVDIYYSDNALQMISDRVVHHVSLANAHGSGLLDLYANEMITGHLILN
jgi:hypothetical protein